MNISRKTSLKKRNHRTAEKVVLERKFLLLLVVVMAKQTIMRQILTNVLHHAQIIPLHPLLHLRHHRDLSLDRYLRDK